MADVLRKDLFALAGEKLFRPGYFILRKTPPAAESLFLEQILVQSSDSHASVYSTPGLIGTVTDPDVYEAIDDGDIGFVTGRGALRVVLTGRANHNTLLVTERCDNRCLFCSQPPKERDDDWLLVQAAMALAAFNTSLTVGISGGEPLLYRKSFIRFLDLIATHTPETPLHILSNGRAFADPGFTQEIAERCKALSITFGVPLYSAISAHHDTLVGAEGAYRETLKGLINAGNSGIPIELRFIPARYNVADMAATVSLATRCLSSLAQISIMNLEPTGWAKRNWADLYLEPARYIGEIEKAIGAAERACLPIVLFNYPLCHLPAALHPYTVKSISDWKNYYPDACEGCRVREQCGGYFASSRGLFHQEARRIA